MSIQGRRVRLFESDLLERLSHVHPLVPLMLWGPIVAWLLGRSLAVSRLSLVVLAWLAAAGLLIWSLAEYLIHRFVFHWEPRWTTARRLVFIVHGVHHETPDDPTRLVMPPVPALVAGSLFYALFVMVLGRAWGEGLFAFFMVGYLAYDYVHLALHRGRPRTRLGAFLRRWHLRHHFVTPDAGWGVSSPLWDYVFRTAPRR
jgi:sterol desaturase/sphingolipid hydroxylase (fatty acid hydroxylase superfamily)